MYNNEDMERFYLRYQTEALPHGTSLQAFCLNNNVPYNIFSKWYKDTRRKAWGDAPRPAVNYTEDMSSDQKDRFIEYLIEQNEDRKLTIRAMQAVLEDFRKEQKQTNRLLAVANAKASSAMDEANAKVEQVLSQLEALQTELRQERRERKALERRNARLQEKLDFVNKNQFGSKSQRSKAADPSKANESSDRTLNEDNFDGTPGSISAEAKI